MTRRTLLASAVASGPAIAVAAAGSAAAVDFTPSSDTALLIAWSDHVTATRRRDALPDDATDAAVAQCDEMDDAARALVESHPARTNAGILIKLRYLFETFGGSDAHAAAAMELRPPTSACLEDHRHRLLWALITDIERMEVRA
ncbi:hypothetical protein ABMY26_36545 (plasmid) [Azospirillum sp. HJ39]|uniref:hypothetical protein n=1 Tax=Azospirillum sp. HJ39 TaxID=3159496 RepID=UPI0035576C5D